MELVDGVERCCYNCRFEDGESDDCGYRLYYACSHEPCPMNLKNFKLENGCKFFEPSTIAYYSVHWFKPNDTESVAVVGETCKK